MSLEASPEDRNRLTWSRPGRRIAIVLVVVLLFMVLAAGGAAASVHVPSRTSSESQATPASASVNVTAVATPVRVIVVDEAGAIREIWSNASGPEYALHVRLGSRSGPDLDATDEVLAQYARLASSVNWSVLGLVFSG